MSEKNKTIAKLAKKIAEHALKQDGNQTTCTYFYQPKAPAQLERFKKEQNDQ